MNGFFRTALVLVASAGIALAQTPVPQSSPIAYQARSAQSDPDILKAWPELVPIKANAPALFKDMTHYVASVQTIYGPATLSMVIGGSLCGRPECDVRIFIEGRQPNTVPACSDLTAHYVSEDKQGIVACGKFLPFL
ncbi:hypothetical protein [Bosea sp. RAC05]|uniref:hypothetical protein n=1 Tax=Bosea sp. RAC05 TaxID=1842539 RepID=UPI000856E5DB|nr:hypothetical protein [Bosea sp. RAC05]AOG03269.1 hypothetical protein BSY19_4903 [Bosea sp. RAC05]